MSKPHIKLKPKVKPVSNVVQLSTKRRNEHLIEALEMLLDEAKDGDLTSFAYCGIYHNTETRCGAGIQGATTTELIGLLYCQAQELATAKAVERPESALNRWTNDYE